jgi:hypothetical protein
MSRLDRLKEYANPVSRDNWRGAGRDQANIDRWSERAEENSDCAEHRAKGGKVALPDTDKPDLHKTDAPPRRNPKVDARMEAKADTNYVGSYLRDVRRQA